MATFTEQVHTIVQAIPKGEVLTYKQVASRAGRPKAFRAVGTILKHNKNTAIPCHRVIRSDGSLGEYNKGTHLKSLLLYKEGYRNHDTKTKTSKIKKS